jgi:hypothetical protein
LCEKRNLVSVYQNYYYHYALAHLKTSSVAVFATWCAAVRRKDFLELGGFNTRIPEPTVEDEELGYALADAGRSIYLARDILVVHHAGYTLRQFARRRRRMAVAQAKSGWRSVRDRLLRRYINIRETGTHHSRWVVLSIVLTVFSTALLVLASLGLLSGWGSWKAFAWSALLALLISQLCHLDFYTKATGFFGVGILPGFMALCTIDMAVLGWGILVGTAQFITGKHY